MNFREYLKEGESNGAKAMIDYDNKVVNGTNADSGTNWTVAKAEDGGFHATIGKGVADGGAQTFYGATVPDIVAILKAQGAQETNIVSQIKKLSRIDDSK